MPERFKAAQRIGSRVMERHGIEGLEILAASSVEAIWITRSGRLVFSDLQYY